MEERKRENERENGIEGAEQLQHDADPLRAYEHAETQEQPTHLSSLQLDGNGGFSSCDE